MKNEQRRTNNDLLFQQSPVGEEGVGVGQPAFSTPTLTRHPRCPHQGGGKPGAWRWAHLQQVREEWFLVLWLCGEVAAYFALSPCPAVRRVMGVALVGTLLAGRLAAHTCQSRRGLVWAAAAASAVLGLLFFAVDYCHYRAEKNLIATIAREVRQHNATAWYLGNGSFEFYAERAGMKHYDPRTGARLAPGDWLVVMDKRARLPSNYAIDDGCAPRAALHVEATFPLRTLLCYYCGNTALEHHEGPLLEAVIYERCDDRLAAK